ncbi:MAG: hypothetical protein ACI87E_005004 [Mariniblastus sp.]|jgi:hypothetical protein
MDFEMDDKQDSGTDKPRSSKKLLWLGILGVIVAGVIALVIINNNAVSPQQLFERSTIDEASALEKVQDALGNSIVVGDLATTPSGESTTFKVPLKGSDGEGILVFTGSLAKGEWTRNSIHLEFNGKEIELDPEGLFDFEIDMGE